MGKSAKLYKKKPKVRGAQGASERIGEKQQSSASRSMHAHVLGDVNQAASGRQRPKRTCGDVNQAASGRQRQKKQMQQERDATTSSRLTHAGHSETPTTISAGLQGASRDQGIDDSNTSNTRSEKLKSKLWKTLEAERSRAGLKRLTTPKQAGIDYLAQWEKKGKR